MCFAALWSKSLRLLERFRTWRHTFEVGGIVVYEYPIEQINKNMAKWYLCIHSLLHSLIYHVFLIIEFHKIPGTFAGPEIKAMNGITRNLGLSRSILLYRRRYGLSQHTIKGCGIETRRVGIREGEDMGH